MVLLKTYQGHLQSNSKVRNVVDEITYITRTFFDVYVVAFNFVLLFIYLFIYLFIHLFVLILFYLNIYLFIYFAFVIES